MSIQPKISTTRISLSVSIALMLIGAMPGRPDEIVTTKSIRTTVGGDPFNIRANAGGLSANERAVIIQNNLDVALSSANNLSASAVEVGVLNRNPVVLFDGKYIATADGNSAARLNLTQGELAQEWARALQQFITNYKVEKERKLSLAKPVNKTTNVTREDIAILPRDMNLPVTLQASISPKDITLGDQIRAVLMTDVPIGPSFKTYLPKGTLVLGEFASAKDYMPNHFGGVDALTPHFHTIRTLDGQDIPIDGHLLGDLNQYKSVTTLPTKAVCCEASAPVVTTTFNRTADLLTQDNCVPAASSGEIQGAWRQNARWYSNWQGFPNHYMDLGYVGLPSYRSNNLSYNGLIIPKHSAHIIPGGVPMLLQLATTTSVAVGSSAGTM